MKTSKTASNTSAVLSWKSFLLRWPPLFAYSFLVVFGAVTPASKIPTFLSRFNDKLIHGTEFFILFWFAVYSMKREVKSRRFTFALAYCTVMGALTEFLQQFVPSRSMSLMDFFADASGFCLAGVLFYFFCRKGT